MITSNSYSDIGRFLFFVIAIVLINFLLLKVAGAKIKQQEILVFNGFGKTTYNLDQIKSANCYHIPPFGKHIANYIVLKIQVEDKIKTYYIKSPTRFSDNYIEYPDLLIERILNMQVK